MMICPKCKKERGRALQVLEFEAKWWASEEFYVADSDGESWIKAKCLTCGTELVESKDKESSKKASKGFASVDSALKPAATTKKKMQGSASGPKGKNEEGRMRICPTCKKARRKVIQVNEWEGGWDAGDGLYIAGSQKNSRIYDKCRVCGTIM